MKVKPQEHISDLYSYPTPHTYDIKYGGRATFKTSCNAISIITDMLRFPNTETVVIRQTFGNHRNSTYRELIKALTRLGFKPKVHYTTIKTELKIKLFNGSYIHFVGLDDVEKLKGYTSSENKTIGILWFFEITEFRRISDIEQVVSTFSRGNKEYWKVYIEFNVAENGIDEYINDKRNDDDTLITFTTINDVNEYERSNWLGEQIIEESEKLKKSNLNLYNYIYLAEPLKDKLLFSFEHFEINKQDRINLVDKFIVIDPKSTGTDYFAVGYFGIDYNQNLILLDCIFTQRQLSRLLIDETIEFIKQTKSNDVYIETNKEYTLAIRLEEELTNMRVHSIHTTQNKKRKILDNAIDIQNINLIENGSKYYNEFIGNIVNYSIEAEHDDAVDVCAMACKIKRGETKW